jgi:cysteine-rich repeat protein
MKREATLFLLGLVASFVRPATGTAYLEEVFPAPPGPNGYSTINLLSLSPDGATGIYAIAPPSSSTFTRQALDLGSGVASPAPVPAAIAAYTIAPIVTANGRSFVFNSGAALVPGDTNGAIDVFLYDDVSLTIERVSLTNGGGQIASPSSALAKGVSADGRFVAFQSNASTLVASDTNGTQTDLFIRDRCVSDGVAVGGGCTPSTVLVSLGPAGLQGEEGCLAHVGHALSDDGRYVTFDCLANVTVFAPAYPCPTPLFLDQPGRCQGTYVRDTCLANGTLVPGCTPSTELVSRTASGEFPPQSYTYNGTISGDGTRVAFVGANEYNLVPGANASGYNLFLHDLASGANQLVTTENLLQLSPPTNICISTDGNSVLLSGTPYPGFNESWIWSDCAAIAPVCGDAQRYAGCEECDDGNLTDADGCDSNCRITGCNNGVVTGSEQCDDGNRVDGDGCDTNCTPTACGNAIRTTGEACDDGNTLDGDGCSSTCAIEPENLMPGGGSPKTECYSELLTRPRPALVKGKLAKVLVCTDDDPSCDFGAATGDHTCTFKVAQCFNLSDPRYPACVASDVSRISVKSPSDGERATPADAANRGRLASAYNALGAFYFGHCTAPADAIGDVCTEDDSCDNGSPGKCGPLAYEFTPPLVTSPRCTDYVDFQVPLALKKSVYKKASAKISLKVLPSNDPMSGKPRKADGETVKLICLPMP